MYSTRVYEQILEKSQTINFAESAPRVASRQQHRQNIPASNISDYYKCTLTIPVLDHLNSEELLYDIQLRRIISILQSMWVKVHIKLIVIYYAWSQGDG